MEGKDNGQLSLTTGSFAFNDLTNKSYSSSQSFGVSANLGLSDKANAADPAQSSTESTLNSSTYSYQNQSSTSVDKTLATVGHGSLTIGGAQGNPDGLNRDADAINKELYSIDRTQGNIDLTVDHRLLSEDGRKAIVEDAKRTEILGKAIADLAEQSVSLTGSGDGESSVRDHIGTTQDYFTATKNFTQSPENKEHVATLENPNATPEQKQAAYTALANAIATYMGVDPAEAKVLMASDPQFAGAYSRDTGIIYVNDAAHDTATAAVTTVGHETQHYLDNQQNPDAVQSPQYQSNREEYADIMGNATADYLNFNFAQNNYALAGSNTHSVGSSYQEALANMSLLSGNQHLYGSENQDNIDNRFLRTEEFQLAERLASESNGKFTTQQILDTLRHANTEGDNAWVVDTALTSAATLHNMDGTEGRLIVTQDEHGQARYIVQNMSQIPLNEDAKAYIQQQGLGYSFTEQYQSGSASYAQEPIWDYRGAGSLAMASGLGFNMDNIDVRTVTQIDKDLEKLNLGMASLVGAPISGAASVYALGGKGTLAMLSAAAGFDAAGQMVQGGEYQPGQTLLAGQAALILGPLASSSWLLNGTIGTVAGGGNVAVKNFYYDDTESVPMGALAGGAFSVAGTVAGNLFSGALKDMPSSVVIPYFQTPATITVTLPAAAVVGKKVETVIQNIPAFIPPSNEKSKSDAERGKE